ncbi:MAG: hypothetical protein LC650_04110 [Actinobacteria bacterium]|nr:hypothetical protein [Actinomycetota bacterium]
MMQARNRFLHFVTVSEDGALQILRLDTFETNKGEEIEALFNRVVQHQLISADGRDPGCPMPARPTSSDMIFNEIMIYVAEYISTKPDAETIAYAKKNIQRVPELNFPWHWPPDAWGEWEDMSELPRIIENRVYFYVSWW